MEQLMIYSSTELAKKFKISKRTLRHYNDIGLIKPSYINDKNYWFYSEEDKFMLGVIIDLKELGFSLENIKKCTTHDYELYDILLLKVEKEINEKLKVLNRKQEILSKVKELRKKEEDYHELLNREINKI